METLAALRAWAFWLAILALCLCIANLATAQHNHERHHSDYQSWSSTKTANCCNNEDCGALNADEWRQTSAGAEIKIEGQWCPVRREHYLTRGKSPDWNTAHACVGKSEYYKALPPCERLLCFSGTGGF